MRLNQSIVQANAFEKHLVNRRRRTLFGKRNVGFTLMLTSMVDMFSMLVCFLLQTFSSTPEIMVLKGMTLPDSITPAIVREAPVISINKDGVSSLWNGQQTLIFSPSLKIFLLLL